MVHQLFITQIFFIMKIRPFSGMYIFSRYSYSQNFTNKTKFSAVLRFFNFVLFLNKSWFIYLIFNFEVFVFFFPKEQITWDGQPCKLSGSNRLVTWNLNKVSFYNLKIVLKIIKLVLLIFWITNWNLHIHFVKQVCIHFISEIYVVNKL